MGSMTIDKRSGESEVADKRTEQVLTQIEWDIRHHTGRVGAFEGVHGGNWKRYF